MSGQGAGFSIKSLIAVVAISAISLALTVYFLTSQRALNPEKSFTSVTYDRGVLGMRAFFDMLLRLDERIKPSSTFYSQYIVNDSLVILSNITRAEEIDRALARFSRAKAILIILPKRKINNTVYHNLNVVNSILSKLVPDARAIRLQSSRIVWAYNDITQADPTINYPQLLSGTGFKPLVFSGNGTLLAEANPERNIWEKPVYILSDPDPLLNHGLDDGKNAVFSISMIKRLKSGGSILIEDRGAGEDGPPSIWKEFFKFPFLALTLTVVAVFLLMCLQSLMRFGSKEPDRSMLKPGRDTILEASSSLVLQGGNYSTILHAYWQQTLRMVGKRFNAPRLSDNEAIIGHLKNIEADINPSVKYIDILNSVQTSGRLDNRHRIIKIAGMMHQWQKEMLREQK